MDLTTTIGGLKLQNPIIIGSSGLSNSIDKIKELAKNNAGAIVLKSIFEEQILSESFHQLKDSTYAEAFDYLKEYTKINTLGNYLKLIENAKKEVEIPIIGSINAITTQAWCEFAKEIESAGADAIELNIAILPVDPNLTAQDIEKIHIEIIENISKTVKIPIFIKLSQYQSALANLVQKIAWTQKVKGITLFNRFYNPDIDINTMNIVPRSIFSNAEDYMPSLRWIALLSEQFKNIDFIASTGIYTGEDVVKQILVGAKAVQVVSAIYKHGPTFINTILNQLKEWMQQNKFNKISDFRCKLSSKNIKNPSIYERIQFMRYYGSIE